MLLVLCFLLGLTIVLFSTVEYYLERGDWNDVHHMYVRKGDWDRYTGLPRRSPFE